MESCTIILNESEMILILQIERDFDCDNKTCWSRNDYIHIFGLYDLFMRLSEV